MVEELPSRDSQTVVGTVEEDVTGVVSSLIGKVRKATAKAIGVSGTGPIVIRRCKGN